MLMQLTPATRLLLHAYTALVRYCIDYYEFFRRSNLGHVEDDDNNVSGTLGLR